MKEIDNAQWSEHKGAIRKAKISWRRKTPQSQEE